MSPSSPDSHPSRLLLVPAGGPQRVVVKFRDGVFVPYEDGAQDHLTGEPADLWVRLRHRAPFSGLRLDRLFTASSEHAIKDLMVRAAHTDPAYLARPDFLTYFVVVCPDLAIATDLVAEFSASPIVERAYVQAPPAPLPAVQTVDDERFADQWYLHPAKRGIDARAAWDAAPTDGAGQRVMLAVVELGWNHQHVDLKEAFDAGRLEVDPISRNYEVASLAKHGTAVLGIVMAVDNAQGCVGAVPYLKKATAVGAYNADGMGSTVYNPPNAIMRAIELLRFGDVMLLEMQSFLSSRELPIELDLVQLPGEGKTAFDLIRLATALGIAVIEPAGNGYDGVTKGVDLDVEADCLRLRRGDAEFRDSGAIMVAGATPGMDVKAPADTTKDTDHEPLPTVTDTAAASNRGSRVDCYAWGERVNTLGWTDNRTTTYTDLFSGTSAASAIVAGAAAAVQGLAYQMLGAPLSAWQIRSLLADPALGTPSRAYRPFVPTDPTYYQSDRIGVMPNLGAIVAFFRAGIADVYIRDRVGDTGLPGSGAVGLSPDIIVRQALVPSGTFAEGSGTEDDEWLSETVQSGQDHYVYVRVRNRGIRSSSPVTIQVFWSPPSTLLAPALWTRVGQPTVILSVPGADVLTVSDAIVWLAADVPGPGHYCFLALASSSEDPAPAPADFLVWDNFIRFVADNNNVAWRNFDVVQATTSGGVGAQGAGYDMPFFLVGPWDRPRQMRLEFESDLPDGAVVELEVLDPPPGLLRPGAGGRPAGGAVPIAVSPAAIAGGRTVVAEGLFPRGLNTACRLRVVLPAREAQRAHRVAIRQTERDLEIGRIAWKLAPVRGIPS